VGQADGHARAISANGDGDELALPVCLAHVSRRPFPAEVWSRLYTVCTDDVQHVPSSRQGQARWYGWCGGPDVAFEARERMPRPQHDMKPSDRVTAPAVPRQGTKRPRSVPGRRPGQDASRPTERAFPDRERIGPGRRPRPRSRASPPTFVPARGTRSLRRRRLGRPR
jgi:hypothetical protein